MRLPALLLVAPTGTAFAQISPQFEKVLAHPGEQKLVVEAAGKSSVILEIPCAEGKFAIAPLFPGATLTDPTLQADVFTSGAMRLQVNRWRDPACRTVYVVDTVVDKVESTVETGMRGPAWSETWTMAACDLRKPVSIAFVPDATGVSFKMDIK